MCRGRLGGGVQGVVWAEDWSQQHSPVGLAGEVWGLPEGKSEPC